MRHRAPLVVVAAVIERDDAFLVTLRQEGAHLAGRWEFPGGKVHEGESHAQALARELLEELDVVGEIGALVRSVTHEYPEHTVELHFYRCHYRGKLRPMLGQLMRWVPRGELLTLPFPEADQTLIAELTGAAT